MGYANRRMRGAWQNKPPVSRTRNRIVILIFAAILLVFAVCVALSFLLGKVRIREITVSEKSSTAYTAEEILAASGLQTGDELWGMDRETIEKNIISACPVVKNVKIRKKWSGKVILTVEDVSLWFYCTDDGNIYLMDADMRVVAVNETHYSEQELIRMVLPDDVAPEQGKVLDFGLSQSYYLTFLASLLNSEKGDRVTAVSLVKRYDLYALYDGKFLFRFGNTDNLGEKLVLIDAALDDSLYDGLTCVSTDVRDIKKMVARPCQNEDIEEVFG